MNHKDTLRAIEFIVENGGSDYYSRLLENKENINYEEEIIDIKFLFIIWMEEFNWNIKETNFMNNYIKGI